jgi:hypothetical protein
MTRPMDVTLPLLAQLANDKYASDVVKNTYKLNEHI